MLNHIEAPFRSTYDGKVKLLAILCIHLINMFGTSGYFFFYLLIWLQSYESLTQVLRVRV